MRRIAFASFALSILAVRSLAAGPPEPTRTPLVRVVDLDIGESQEVELADGKSAKVRLIDLEEVRDEIRGAVREARVRVEVNGQAATLVSANYRLPVEVGKALAVAVAPVPGVGKEVDKARFRQIVRVVGVEQLRRPQCALFIRKRHINSPMKK